MLRVSRASAVSLHEGCSRAISAIRSFTSFVFSASDKFGSSVSTCGLYFLIPARKIWYLVAIYFIDVVLFGGLYVMVGNRTKMIFYSYSARSCY